jgi:hypothetical protein
MPLKPPAPNPPDLRTYDAGEVFNLAIVIIAAVIFVCIVCMAGCTAAQLEAADPATPATPIAFCPPERTRPDGVCCPIATPDPRGPDADGYYCQARYFTPETADDQILNPW